MTTIILLIISEGLAQGFSLIGAKKGKSWWHATTWDVISVRSTMNHFSRTLLSRPSVCWPSMFVLLAHDLSFMNLQKAFRRAISSRDQSRSLKMVQNVACLHLPQLCCSGHGTERKGQQTEDLISKTLLTKSFNFSKFGEVAGGDRGDFL